MIKQHAIIEFLMLEGVTATEIYQKQMIGVYGENFNLIL